ncbi:MAG: DPP IV N-terminal domain-containing protein [Elusimicrobiota bacterium]|jgi:TolB protein|nr:DPP IV N-terminal domain-containing protein [Elusimicrobiota bacterium]
MKKLIFVFALLFFAQTLFAQSNIYITLASSGKKFNIGIDARPMSARSPQDVQYAKSIGNVIENDLILSRYFNVISADVRSANIEDSLKAWSQADAHVLFNATVSVRENAIVLNVRMYDIASKQIVWETAYNFNDKSDYRTLSHIISNEIVKRFTGEEGIALSKIAFVNNGTKFKELYVVDYDGHNLKRLTRDAKLNMLPKWSPDGNQIIYTSYLFNNPDLFSINLGSNKRSVISKYQGLNSAGTFSPSGKNIMLTLSRGLFPNLYVIDNGGRLVARMTDGAYIDTSPSYAPSGKEVVFISDRIGYPQMYIMGIDGKNVRRLPTNGYCDSPAWSPRGDKIAFTMRQGRGNFNLYIYDLRTTKITRITNNQGDNENPDWSPDGRFLVFSSSRSGRWEIYVMAIDGSGTRKLVDIPSNSYTPAWSPNISNEKL